MARLEQYYKESVVPDLMKKLGYANVMQVPRITKITLNMGVGEAIADKKAMEGALADMEKISGQKPVTNKARKSVANFKVRAGWLIGCNPLVPSTVAAITLSVSASRSFSRKSITTK
jgi:large subunit ribosomal protein L5